MTIAEKMQALIDSFPCLKAKGMTWQGYDNTHFHAQCRGLSGGERECAAFVLHVWNWREPLKGWRFDFGSFVNRCDDTNLAVVREWMRAPWYA